MYETFEYDACVIDIYKVDPALFLDSTRKTMLFHRYGDQTWLSLRQLLRMKRRRPMDGVGGTRNPS